MKHILEKGYFPRELPTPFTSKHFANFVHTSPLSGDPFFTSKGKTPNWVTRPVEYNQARPGALRRKLSLVNPINYFQLVNLVSSNWTRIAKFIARTDHALSSPVYSGGSGSRSLDWRHGFETLPNHRARSRAGKRYLVKTDIQGCYPNIYTHTISWALHSKEKAKDNTNYWDLWGNRIDRLIQNGQEKQTKGLPIGPDTSLVAAELILTAIDVSLSKFISKNRHGYFRYLDDYEFSVESHDQAERALSILQEALSDFELVLNEAKTAIIELPVALEQPWVGTLRNQNIASSGFPSRQETGLIDFFDKSIECWRANQADGVIRYAVIKSAASYISLNNWSLYEGQLMSWATTEPEVLPLVLEILYLYKGFGYKLELDSLRDTLGGIISRHSMRGHTSEVAWAIWGHILFDLSLSPQTTKTVCAIDNSVIALLALDAEKKPKSLLSTHKDFTKWARHMAPDELKGEHWLLAYEARVKKWLPPVSSKEYIKTAFGFAELGTANISFYDRVNPAAHTPSHSKLKQLQKTFAQSQAISAGYPSLSK